jgi:hypothetical protein
MRRVVGIAVLCGLIGVTSSLGVWAQSHQDEPTLWQSRQFDAEVGISYVRGRSRFVLGGLPPLRSDVVTAPLALRYGLSDRFQISLTLPLLASSSTWDTEWKSGIGNLEGKIAIRLLGNGLDTPALIAEFGTSFPTASGDFGPLWQPFTTLSVFREVSPLLFFAQGGFAYPMETEVHGIRLRPGLVVQTQGGLGLRLDDTKLLWLKAAAVYHGETRLAGRTMPGSDQLLSHLEVALTWAIRKDVSVEFSIAPGLTQEAPDVVLGLTLTWSTLIPSRRERR